MSYSKTLTRHIVRTGGQPVPEAYMRLTCYVAELGYVPYDGYSKADGLVTIGYDGNIEWWIVEKHYFIDADGTGNPPEPIVLKGVSEDGGDAGNGVVPPEQSNVSIVLIVLAVIVFLGWLALRGERR